MKTMIFRAGIFAICMMPLAFVSAQQSFLVGVQGTPHMSWLMNQDDRDNASFKYLPTFTGSFGITSQFNFTPNTGIGLDALYSYQGQRYELSGIERFRMVEYVKIPLMLVYSYEVTPGVMLIGKIGPQAGMLVNARLLDKDGDRIVSDHKNAYEDFELSGVAVGGAGFKLSDNLFFDALLRFDYGFTDAEDKDYKPNVNNPTVSNEGKITTNRAVTNNSTAGVTIGIRYLVK